MLYYLITYKKNNNTYIHRIISTPMYELGDYNGYGWLVVDIQFFYNGRFYSMNEFENIFNKEKNIENRKRLKRDSLKNPISKSLNFIDKKINNTIKFIDKL